MKEFQLCFAVKRGIVFEVSYYTLGSNKSAHFSTSAAQFNRPRTDYERCGQAQRVLLKGLPKAFNFYHKWDKYHIKSLDQPLYESLMHDIEELKKAYPHFKQTNGEDISFREVVAVERVFRGVTLRSNQ